MKKVFLLFILMLGFVCVNAKTSKGKEVPESGNVDGYAYVDLDLPSGLKWASCNLGANNPWDYGDYYEFPNSGKAVTSKWSTNWRVPSRADFEELLHNCKWEWTTLEGINGYKVSSKKHKKKWIFLPAAGRFYGTKNFNMGTDGNYWSSTDFDWTSYRSCYYLMTEPTKKGISHVGPFCKQSVRPVTE